MTKTVQALADAIPAAAAERAVFAGGRLAFYAIGPHATNPYPTGSTEHRLWAAGMRQVRQNDIEQQAA